MENNRKNFFWVSYVDLMTALFAVVLVLFILSFKKLNDEISAKKEELRKIEEVKNNLKVLMSDTAFFKYEKDYKRYRLAQNITFKLNQYEIDNKSVENFEETKEQLTSTGEKLKNIIDSLKIKKEIDTVMKELSYLMIISGRSSNLDGNDINHNYILSYKRAFSLYNFWKPIIDFDDLKYHKLLDFQIAGNGIGGIGRFPDINESGEFDKNLEMKNQSFLIQIIPKVGEIDSALYNSNDNE